MTLLGSRMWCARFADSAGTGQASEIRAALPDVCLVVGGPATASAGLVGFEQVVDTVPLHAGQACDAFEQAASADATAGHESRSDGTASDGSPSDG